MATKKQSSAVEREQLELLCRMVHTMERMEQRLTMPPAVTLGQALHDSTVLRPAPAQVADEVYQLTAAEVLRTGIERALTQRCVWIPSELLVAIYRRAFPAKARQLSHRQALAAAYALAAEIPECSRYLESFPHRGEGRRRGVAWRLDLAREGIEQLDDEAPAGDPAEG